jgi:hypothetical protein
MQKRFRVGDHVTWNSEAGHVSGRIVKVHTRNVNYKGYVHHASKDDPQYEIKSDKTDHVALPQGNGAETPSPVIPGATPFQLSRRERTFGQVQS